MKYTVTIEETLSQDFEVHAANLTEALALAEKKYKSGEFVLCPGELTGKQMRAVCTENGESTDWVNF